MEDTLKGVVKWFDNHKGYGFITGDNGEDIFVHYTAITEDGYKKLAQDDRVSYGVRIDDKGRTVAQNVTKVS